MDKMIRTSASIIQRFNCILSVHFGILSGSFGGILAPVDEGVRRTALQMLTEQQHLMTQGREGMEETKGGGGGGGGGRGRDDDYRA